MGTVVRERTDIYELRSSAIIGNTFNKPQHSQSNYQTHLPCQYHVYDTSYKAIVSEVVKQGTIPQGSTISAYYNTTWAAKS